MSNPIEHTYDSEDAEYNIHSISDQEIVSNRSHDSNLLRPRQQEVLDVAAMAQDCRVTHQHPSSVLNFTGATSAPTPRLVHRESLIPINISSSDDFGSPTVRNCEAQPQPLLSSRVNASMGVNTNASTEERNVTIARIAAIVNENSRRLITLSNITERNATLLVGLQATLASIVRERTLAPSPATPATIKRKSCKNSSGGRSTRRRNTGQDANSHQIDTVANVGRRLFTASPPLLSQRHRLQALSPSRLTFVRYEPHENVLGRRISITISLPFHYSRDMRIITRQKALAAYAFREDSQNEDEVLVQCPIASITRREMQQFRPSMLLECAMLDCIATMLTVEHRARTGQMLAEAWFMPALFARYVSSYSTTLAEVIEYYRESHMGYVEYVQRIYVPINDSGMHWFLLLIDIRRREAVILDSWRNTERRNTRRNLAIRVSGFLSQMFIDRSFYENIETPTLEVDQFDLVNGEGFGQQDHNSNDCGVWVMQWMRNYELDGYNILVDEGTRLRMAIDVMDGIFNSQRTVVSERANAYVVRLQDLEDEVANW